MTIMENRGLDYYMTLPYSILLIPDEEEGWFAKVPELPGCMTFGDSQAEVLELIEEAKRLWIEAVLELGHRVPLPGETPSENMSTNEAKTESAASAPAP